jgi:hypothetical protein
MKKLILLTAVLIGFISAKAQNPFAELGYEAKVATLSQGKYIETFDNDTIVQIGSILFNTKSKQIVAFVQYDTMYSESNLQPDIVSRWLSPDPLAKQFPSWSPYNYVENNPVRYIDPDGKSKKPYLVFDGKTNTIKIFDDKDTPLDYGDDLFIGEFKAHNYVASNSKGKWEDGIFEMLDKNSPFKHGDSKDSKGILQDSPEGAYGEKGIFRAKEFSETTTDETRSGMGVHAGREKKDFEKRVTMGCIRCEPDAIEAIEGAIDKHGPLQNIIIKNNRDSQNSDKVKDINPPTTNKDEN